MRRAISLLLVLCVLLALTGCEDSAAAVAMGERMIAAMKGRSLSFRFQISHEAEDREFSEFVAGSGSVTGLFTEDTRVGADFWAQGTITQSFVKESETFRTERRSYTMKYNNHMVHYRDGVMYYAHRDVCDYASSPFLNVGDFVAVIPYPEGLRASLRGEGVYADTFHDIRVTGWSGGWQMECAIAPDSDLGMMINVLLNLQDVGSVPFPGTLSGIDAYIRVGEDGTLQLIEMVVARENDTGTYRRTVSIKVTGYDAVNPVRFPDYVK